MSSTEAARVAVRQGDVDALRALLSEEPTSDHGGQQADVVAHTRGLSQPHTSSDGYRETADRCGGGCERADSSREGRPQP